MTLDAVTQFALDDDPSNLDFCRIRLEKTGLVDVSGLSYSDCMLLLFAKAGSSNPPQVPAQVLEIADTVMTPGEVVEMVTWLSTLNMLHRLYAYYFPGSFDGARTHPYADDKHQ